MDLNAPPSQMCEDCREYILWLERELQFIDPHCFGADKAFDRAREDWYPSLSNLQTSAAAGCELCRLLRAAALSNEAVNALNDQSVNIHDRHMVRIQMGYGFERAKSETSVRDRPSGVDPTDVAAIYCQFRLAIGEQTILTSHLARGLLKPSIELYVMYALAHCCISLPLTRGSYSIPRPNITGRFFPLKHLPPPLHPYALHQDPVHLINSAIQRCISTCGHSHDANEAFLPSRLIDVRGETLRVVKSAEIGLSCQSDQRYLALSYCWGGMSQLTFDTSTEAWLSSGFSFDDLTPVQADTVSVAKALSISYIWIDALCIRQGDKDDWDHESSLMDKVYANSFVTVCAVSSGNCQQGYLRRDGARIPVGKTSSDIEDATTSPSFFIQALPIVSKGTPDHPLTYELESSAWIRRAWTYQENALSTRCIFFCHSGVHFRCSSFECSEYFGVVGRSRSEGSTPADTRVLLREDFTKPKDETSINLAWAQVISDYSRREVTNATDLFPALSGLAKEFSIQFGSQQYVAGLWRKELLKGLMWRVEEKPNQLPGAYLSFKSLLKKLCGQPYIGPSWSWVGREQDIQPCDQYTMTGIPDYDGYSISTPAYKILEPSVTLLSANVFGRISAARLTLETHIYPLSRGVHLADVPEPTLSLPGTNGLSVHLGGEDGPWCQLEVDWKIRGEKDFLGSLTLAILGSSTISEKIQSFILEEEKVTRNVKRPFGLVLHSAPGKERYLRVGVFSVPVEALAVSGVSHWKFFEDCKVQCIEVM